jgi:hypothetical protein
VAPTSRYMPTDDLLYLSYLGLIGFSEKSRKTHHMGNFTSLHPKRTFINSRTEIRTFAYSPIGGICSLIKSNSENTEQHQSLQVCHIKNRKFYQRNNLRNIHELIIQFFSFYGDKAIEISRQSENNFLCKK